LQSAPEGDLEKQIAEDLEELSLVSAFGIEPVYGIGPLPLANLRKLRTLGNLRKFWEIKDAQENQAEWAEKNPDAEGMIQWAIVQAQRQGLIDDQE